MKKFSVIFLGLLFVAFGCQKKADLSKVTNIIITNNADVKIVRGDKVMIASDDKKDDDSLSYTVVGNVLTISGNSDAVLYLPDLTNIGSITVSMNGDLEADDDNFSFDSLLITVVGEGDASLQLTGKTLILNLKDDADLKIKGNSNYVGLTASGNADYDGKDLVAKDYLVNLSGNSEAHVNATNSISGELSDYADLYYQGIDASALNLVVHDSAQVHEENN